ncbi:putative RNA-binding protein EEED8.10 isoform X2 [Brevipalpus obovatus]|uniref:putative RNA-binding protein EEED8.10 isoform X2 n=1 Tax=Brevipalpus obovatus TaxID=246614 RepID=UPI003D9FA400
MDMMNVDHQCPADQEDVTILPSEEVNQGTKSILPSKSIHQPIELYKFIVQNIGDNEGLTMKSFTMFYQRFFEKNFGNVKKFHVFKDLFTQKPLGYGFVIFENRKSAVKALNASRELLTIDLAPVLGVSSEKSRTPNKRILEISPSQATLLSIVRNFVKRRKEGKDRKIEERQQIVSELMSKKISRQLIPDETYYMYITCEIQKLSDEVIRIIFDQLGHYKDLASCELVCRRWNTVAKGVWISKKSLNLTPHLISLKGSKRSEKAFSILKKFSGLKELNLRGLSGIDAATLDIVGECCPMLESISFGGTFLSQVSLKHLAEHCSRLKVIDLSSCLQLTEQNLFGLLKIATGLKCLNIRGHTSITGDCFQNLEHLEILDVRRCRRLTDESFIKLANKCQSSLRELRAGPVSKSTLYIICGTFHNLNTLELEDNLYGPTSISFDFICKLEKLGSLKINSSLTLDLDDRKLIKLLKFCKNLQTLHLHAKYDLTDEGVSKIPDLCTEMRHLSISSSKVNTSLDSLSRLKYLETLSLRNTRVTDEGVKNFKSKYSNSISLDFQGEDTIDQESLDYFQW